MPTEEPAITIRTQCPIEYNNNMTIPKVTFPFVATKARIAASIGVAQGDERAPPNIPKKNAPINPFLLLGILQVLLSLVLITPTAWSPTKSIINPSNRYHHFPAPEKNFPSTADNTPKDTKVKINPKANTREYLKARFLSFFAFVPTYPITKGTVDSKHGLKDEISPATKDINSAINILPDISAVKLFI